MDSSNKKPLIGVMPLWDSEKESIWMLPHYLDAIIGVGGLPIVFPFTADLKDVEQLTALCSGILLTGGQDVSPSVYAMEDETGKTIPSPLRDSLESHVLEIALEKSMPILGICRGLQFINAFLGGTLYQDIPLQYPTNVNHRQFKPYDRPIHKVTLSGSLKNLLSNIQETSLQGKSAHAKVEQDALMQRSMAQDFIAQAGTMERTDELAVNSLHHQAIRKLAPALQPMAVSEDGLIEAVEMPDKKFVWAVQWHPEFLFRSDAFSVALFRYFVESCS